MTVKAKPPLCGFRAPALPGTSSSGKPTTTPEFKKVLESGRESARRAARWQNDASVDCCMACNRYFAKRPQRDFALAI